MQTNINNLGRADLPSQSPACAEELDQKCSFYSRFVLTYCNSWIRLGMPIYEYRCGKCERLFEELVRSKEEKVRCPACGSRKVERLFRVLHFTELRRYRVPVAQPVQVQGRVAAAVHPVRKMFVSDEFCCRFSRRPDGDCNGSYLKRWCSNGVNLRSFAV